MRTPGKVAQRLWPQTGYFFRRYFMKIQDKSHVTFEYTLSLDSGEVVDKSEPGQPLSFVCGFNQIIPGLEKELMGMEEGQTANITVEAEDAYGLASDELIREIPRENFPEDVDIQPGMGFEANGPQGPVRFRVKSADDKVVMADFNHPLAGERLHFDVKITAIRELTDAEASALSTGCSPACCSSCGNSCG